MARNFRRYAGSGHGEIPRHAGCGCLHSAAQVVDCALRPLKFLLIDRKSQCNEIALYDIKHLCATSSVRRFPRSSFILLPDSQYLMCIQQIIQAVRTVP
jgi:hypothetical protein